MALDFPNSPSVNDSFSAGGKTWVYNGTKWVLLGVSLNQTVVDGSITTAKIATGAVTATKLGNDIHLDHIGDVTITSAAAGQTIQWNGSAWVNATVSSDVMTDTRNAAIILMDIGA